MTTKNGAGHPPCLTFRHWSGVTPYTSSYEFAGSCVFGKQSPGILSLRPRQRRGRPYSEGTAAFLPSSLEHTHSFALVFSTCTPVSVCGTDVRLVKHRSFSWKALHRRPPGLPQECPALSHASGGFACRTVLRARTPIQ